MKAFDQEQRLTLSDISKDMKIMSAQIQGMLRETYVPPKDEPPMKAGRSGALALIVGHTADAQGAGSVHRLIGPEWIYNKALADDIMVQAAKASHDCKVFFRVQNGSRGIADAYARAEDWLDTFNNVPCAIIELHNNYATPAAYGTETLFNDSADEDNVDERFFAKAVQDAMCEALERKGKGDRGLKYRPKGMRGSFSMMQVVKYPSVLTEGFFASSQSDCELVIDKRDAYVLSFVKAFTKYCDNYNI